MIPETTLNENEIFQSNLISLNLRQAQLENGSAVERVIVRSPGAVVIIPLTVKYEVRLVKQFRSAAEKWILELPAGTLEVNEDPALAAPRELLEETGDKADTWQYLGGFYTAPGVFTEYLHLYLATGLTPGPNQLEFDEHIEVITLPWKEVIALIKQNKIEDAKTIAGIMRAGLRLNIPFN